MPIGDGLTQSDFGYLCLLGYGELANIPRASANKLMALHLIEPVGALDGARVTGIKSYNVDITRRGRGMVSSVHTGQESRFTEPRS